MSTTDRQPTPDERMGMTWYNRLTEFERRLVLAAADRVLGRDSAPADAWTLWKSGQIRMDGRVISQPSAA